MPRIVQTRLAYDGYAKVSVLTLEEEGGERHQREVVSFGQSACVLPYDPERRVALIVRLPRAPLLADRIVGNLIEAPAGMIGPDETAEAAIRREAMEEAGVRLGDLEPVAVCWPSPGVLAERTHLFLAAYRATDRVGAGGGLAEEHEGISVDEIPLADLERAANAGDLRDLKTLTLVLALRLRRHELFAPRPREA
ncbi:MAG TPA: NUDIX hydrolase [Caulobacteraceae bacterium]|jgi:nudix-type nucleoside diphosphatase (YffH/AdpP family)